MKRDFDEVKKFEIIMDLKSIDTENMNADSILDYIEEKHGVSMVKSTFYRWSRKFNIPYYKKVGGKISSIEKEHLKNVQRLKQLTLVVKNLCKEVGVKSPECLNQLLCGIEKDLTLLN